MYRTSSGELVKTLYSKKYGCSCVTFTHASQAVLYASKVGLIGQSNQRRPDPTARGFDSASTDPLSFPPSAQVKQPSKDPKKDHALRYHSLYNNEYIRYFVGHTAQVVNVSMDAVTDEFLTASADGTVRLWDLRTPACNGVIRCATTPCVASDLQGLIFAAATDDGELKLYDARKYGQGPFIDFQVGSVDPGTGKRPRVTCAKFSPDGEGLLCVAGGTMYIIDAFKGDELMRINVGAETGGMGQGKDAAGATGNNLEACWTPDNKCLLSGGADSRVHVWSAVNGSKVATWGARHAGIPSSVRWAPGMMLAASACTEGGCALWIPKAGGGQ